MGAHRQVAPTVWQVAVAAVGGEAGWGKPQWSEGPGECGPGTGVDLPVYAPNRPPALRNEQLAVDAVDALDHELGHLGVEALEQAVVAEGELCREEPVRW